MPTKGLFIRIFQVLILLGVIAGLYFYWHAHETAQPIIDDDDIHVTEQVTVQTGKIELRTLRQYADVAGVVETQPARDGQPAGDQLISMPMPGWIASINCTEGSHVTAGQVLIQLDDRSARAQLQLAEARVKAAQQASESANRDASVLQRDKLRFARDLADCQAQFAAAQAAVDQLAIVSSINGTVIRLNVHAGESPSVGTPLLEVADESRLVIACSTPVGLLTAIHPGQACVAVVNDPAGNELQLGGRVSFIDPGLEPASLAGSVDVILDGSTTQPAGLPIRLGQTVRVRLITEEHRALAVPEVAIVQDAGGQANISMVVRDFRWAIRQPVQTGLHDAGWVEVSAPGLAENQDVVTVGSYALTDKCRIEVTR